MFRESRRHAKMRVAARTWQIFLSPWSFYLTSARAFFLSMLTERDN